MFMHHNVYTVYRQQKQRQQTCLMTLIPGQPENLTSVSSPHNLPYPSISHNISTSANVVPLPSFFA